jgi:hypothetical protein
MKNTILVSILSIAIVFILKKGIEAVEKSGEKVDFFNAFKTGLKITIDSFSKQDTTAEKPAGTILNYENEKPKNYEMVSFTNPVNAFHGIGLKRQRGAFHMPTMISHSN